MEKHTTWKEYWESGQAEKSVYPFYKHKGWRVVGCILLVIHLILRVTSTLSRIDLYTFLESPYGLAESSIAGLVFEILTYVLIVVYYLTFHITIISTAGHGSRLLFRRSLGAPITAEFHEINLHKGYVLVKNHLKIFLREYENKDKIVEFLTERGISAQQDRKNRRLLFLVPAGILVLLFVICLPLFVTDEAKTVAFWVVKCLPSVFVVYFSFFIIRNLRVK